MITSSVSSLSSAWLGFLNLRSPIQVIYAPREKGRYYESIGVFLAIRYD